MRFTPDDPWSSEQLCPSVYADEAERGSPSPVAYTVAPADAFMGQVTDRAGACCNEEDDAMRNLSRGRLAFGVLMITAGTMAAREARATTWTVCNRSAEDVSVAIAFNLKDARQYISKGWWTLRACGGCKVVFSGNLPITGAFLRGEGADGDKWEGETLFCTAPRRFEIPNANVDERTCRARGQEAKQFKMHVLNTQNYTTTLRDTRRYPGKKTCID